jgi:hypothetical protein
LCDSSFVESVKFVLGRVQHAPCLPNLIKLENGLDLLRAFRDRLQYPDLRRKIASLAAQYGAQTILIEDAGPGLTLLQDLRHTPPSGMPHPIGQKPNGSKADRVVAQSAKSKLDMFTCLETPIGSTASCSSCSRFRMADTTTRSIASHNS